MQYLTPWDASRVIGLSPSTIRGLVDRGALEAIRTENGTRLIPREAAERFATERAEKKAAAAVNR